MRRCSSQSRPSFRALLLCAVTQHFLWHLFASCWNSQAYYNSKSELLLYPEVSYQDHIPINSQHYCAIPEIPYRLLWNDVQREGAKLIPQKLVWHQYQLSTYFSKVYGLHDYISFSGFTLVLFLPPSVNTRQLTKTFPQSVFLLTN